MACAILPSQELTNFFIKDKEEPAANVDVRVRRSVVTVPDEAYIRSVVPVTTTVDSPVFVSTLFSITSSNNPIDIYGGFAPPYPREPSATR